MGDPKFLRRTYDTPKHPWEATRMDEERVLLDKYGLKNKRELWKAQSILPTDPRPGPRAAGALADGRAAGPEGDRAAPRAARSSRRTFGRHPLAR